MINKHCLFCKTAGDYQEIYPQNFCEQDLSPATFSARRTTEHWHYRIVRCQVCGQLFSSPVLDSERLNVLYRESLFTYSDETENIAASYFRPLKEHENRLSGRDCAVEIGCGNGFFLTRLEQLGFKNRIGFEPSEQATSLATSEIRPYLRNLVFEKNSLPADSVDLICCFQTLDHLYDPRLVLANCREVLRKDGIAYFITHNEQSLQAKILKDRSPIFDVEHIYLFNKKTLRRLFEECGFEVLSVFNVTNRYSLRYWIRMTPLPFKKQILKIVALLGLGGISVGIPAGNIGIIARKDEP